MEMKNVDNRMETIKNVMYEWRKKIENAYCPYSVLLTVDFILVQMAAIMNFWVSAKKNISIKTFFFLFFSRQKCHHWFSPMPYLIKPLGGFLGEDIHLFLRYETASIGGFHPQICPRCLWEVFIQEFYSFFFHISLLGWIESISAINHIQILFPHCCCEFIFG